MFEDITSKCWRASRTLAFHVAACNFIDRSRVGIEDKPRKGENCPLRTGFLGLDVKWQTDCVVVLVARLSGD